MIGHTVNKTARLCSSCPPNRIHVSKEAHGKITTFSNVFHFKRTSVRMKGIGQETAYFVSKTRSLGVRAKNAAVAVREATVDRPVLPKGAEQRLFDKGLFNIKHPRMLASLLPG